MKNSDKELQSFHMPWEEEYGYTQAVNKHFCTDAWKINSVTVTLESKDKNGNPAPSGYASKIISFPVSSSLLGFTAGCNPFWVTDGKTCGHSDQLQKMVLKTDEYFNPLPAKLISYFTDDVN